MQDRTGDIGRLPQVFLPKLERCALDTRTRTKAADLALKLYRAQAFEEAWDSKSHFMELYQTKQAIDQLFSQEKRPNLSY